jgi:hypothetical protein
MIKIMVEKNKEYFLITISNKQIYYWDKLQGKLWGSALRYLPPDSTNTLAIINSRNKIPNYFIKLLEIPADELKEFQEAKNDKELMELVIRDAKKNMCKIVDIKIE